MRSLAARCIARILVGYDGREGGRDALALARGLAAIEGAELILVAALELRPAGDARRRLRARRRRGRGAALGLGARGPRRDAVRAAHLRRRSGAAGADRVRRARARRRDRARLDPPRGPRPGAAGQRRRAPPARRRPLRGAGRAERVRRAASGSRSQRSGSATTAATRPGTRARSPPRSPPSSARRWRRSRSPRSDGDPAEVLAARSRELDLLVVGSRGYGPVRQVADRRRLGGADAEGGLPGAGRAPLGGPAGAARRLGAKALDQPGEGLAGLGAGGGGSSARATSIAISSSAPSSAWASGSTGWRRISPASIPAVSRPAISPSP